MFFGGVIVVVRPLHVLLLAKNLHVSEWKLASPKRKCRANSIESAFRNALPRSFKEALVSSQLRQRLGVWSQAREKLLAAEV